MFHLIAELAKSSVASASRMEGLKSSETGLGFRDVGRVGNPGDSRGVIEALGVDAQDIGKTLLEDAQASAFEWSESEIHKGLSVQETGDKGLVPTTPEQIFERAGLVQEQVFGRECLIRPDMDWETTDGLGRTNLERAEMGHAPLDPEGRPYELHHIGQTQDSPFAELTMPEHRGPGNYGVLHDPSIRESRIDRATFDNIDRPAHWMARAEAFKGAFEYA